MSYSTEFMVSGGLDGDYIKVMIGGIIVLLVGVFLFSKWKTLQRSQIGFMLITPLQSIILLFVGGLMLLFGVVMSYLHIRQASELLEIYNTEQYKIAEGYVDVLHEQPDSGHDDGDMVEIGGTKFVIDNFTPTSSYDMTIAKGGVLKEGVYAKVYYHRYDYDNKIIRIDIRRD